MGSRIVINCAYRSAESHGPELNDRIAAIPTEGRATAKYTNLAGAPFGVFRSLIGVN
jgi:hypothetical protein